MALFSRAFDWLSDVVAFNLIRGTNGADTLDAQAEGDLIRGLRGNDVLSSTFDHTALIGDAGDDTLTTNATNSATGTRPGGF